MATQRLIVATLAGDSAAVVATRFRSWAAHADAAAVDCFCDALRKCGDSLPVVYFCEWIDRWLMGNLVPRPGCVDGQRYQATCLTPQEAVSWSDLCGQQFEEQKWLAARLREAAFGWGPVTDRYAVVVIREVIGPSSTDEDVEASLHTMPGWLSGIDGT
jgi:hypothetical protein